MRQVAQSCSHKRGAVLIAALVCLGIAVAIVGSMLVAALTNFRQLRAERDLRQCELLLQAGTDRAAYRAANEPDYRGETWTLPADQIVGSGDGSVTIEIPAQQSGESRQLHIIAEYPTGNDWSIRRSRVISISSKTPSSEE